MKAVARPIALAWTAVLALVAVSLWGWAVFPGRPGRWLFVALLLPALWAFAEVGQSGDRVREREEVLNWHRLCMGWAGLMLALVVASQLAIASGLVDAVWGPAVRRMRGMILGVSMMVWGNYLPKLMSPWSLDSEPFDWQRVHRFAGWGFLLGGLAVVLAWAALPPAEAGSASRVIIGLACVLVVGRKLLSLASPPRRPSTPRIGANPS